MGAWVLTLKRSNCYLWGFPGFREINPWYPKKFHIFNNICLWSSLRNEKGSKIRHSMIFLHWYKRIEKLGRIIIFLLCQTITIHAHIWRQSYISLQSGLKAFNFIRNHVLPLAAMSTHSLYCSLKLTSQTWEYGVLILHFVFAFAN